MVIEREKIKAAITNNYSNSIKTTAKVSKCGSQNGDIQLLENLLADQDTLSNQLKNTADEI